jgi:ribosomal protein S18 acetylase RimI-like enzyme
MKDVVLRDFEISDWRLAWDLWESELKKSNDSSWNEANVAMFLKRNPRLSLVAIIDGRLVGTVMCGFDGRRGYIYHLAVANTIRRNGIGTALMKVAISKLKQAGADKIHLMLMVENECARIFYDKLGFENRKDITIMSIKNS